MKVHVFLETWILTGRFANTVAASPFKPSTSGPWVSMEEWICSSTSHWWVGSDTHLQVAWSIHSGIVRLPFFENGSAFRCVQIVWDSWMHCHFAPAGSSKVSEISPPFSTSKCSLPHAANRFRSSCDSNPDTSSSAWPWRSFRWSKEV